MNLKTILSCLAEKQFIDSCSPFGYRGYVLSKGDKVISCWYDQTRLIVTDRTTDDMKSYIYNGIDFDSVGSVICSFFSHCNSSKNKFNKIISSYRESFVDCVIYPFEIVEGGVVYKDAAGKTYLHQEDAPISLLLFDNLYGNNREWELLSLPNMNNDDSLVIASSASFMSEGVARQELRQNYSMLSRYEADKKFIPSRFMLKSVNDLKPSVEYVFSQISGDGDAVFQNGRNKIGWSALKSLFALSSGVSDIKLSQSIKVFDAKQIESTLTGTKAVSEAIQKHILDSFESYEDMLSEMKHYQESYGPRFAQNMTDDATFLAYHDDVRQLFQDILGQTPEEQEKYSDEQTWNLYKNLIDREARHIIAEDGRSYIKPASAKKAKTKAAAGYESPTGVTYNDTTEDAIREKFESGDLDEYDAARELYYGVWGGPDQHDKSWEDAVSVVDEWAEFLYSSLMKSGAGEDHAKRMLDFANRIGQGQVDEKEYIKHQMKEFGCSEAEAKESWDRMQKENEELESRRRNASAAKKVLKSSKEVPFDGNPAYGTYQILDKDGNLLESAGSASEVLLLLDNPAAEGATVSNDDGNPIDHDTLVMAAEAEDEALQSKKKIALKSWSAKDYNIQIEDSGDWVETVANLAGDVAGIFGTTDPDEIFAKLVEGGFPESGEGADSTGNEFHKEDVMHIIEVVAEDFDFS